MSIIHQIGLTLIPGVGHVTAKNLLGHFGSAEAIFKAKNKDLLSVAGIGTITANQITSSNVLFQAEVQLKYIEKHQIEVLFFTEPNYPRRLKECSDGPVLLYYKGTANLNHPRIISVVGTRMATDYGRQLCASLAEILKPYNVIIVSGLAYGIDVAAHKESLRNEIPTVGVLGHGLDRVYPYHHTQIAQDMLKNGGLLTEFPLNTMPDRENFPKRNRVIAGISDATVVVEATVKGGALITADIANSYNRDVYAFPGRVKDEFSQGCNFLIKTHRASLINHPLDLVYYMGWDELKPVKSTIQTQLPLGLSAEEIKVLEVLRMAPSLIDEISVKANIPQGKLAIHLLNLEMQGVLIALPGKMYKLN
ncbi:DNA processing protein [Pedobacter sp. CG_S7]|uniref:DNA-processing protein DprA n=1 Tax=Pedobacter sp. CG_S7 TaxID=3143930 RepID=UPI0033917EB4